jgi:hypothetical protein
VFSVAVVLVTLLLLTPLLAHVPLAVPAAIVVVASTLGLCGMKTACFSLPPSDGSSLNVALHRPRFWRHGANCP